MPSRRGQRYCISIPNARNLGNFIQNTFRQGIIQAQHHHRIADIGCGSGILSIAALLLGAKRAYAVDTDPLTIASTNASRELNGIDPDRLIVELGSLDHLTEMLPAPVDGFVCNILAEVILDLIPGFRAIAKPTTWGVLSGILLDQVKPIADSLEANGWIVATLWRRQDWCCLNIRRS